MSLLSQWKTESELAVKQLQELHEKSEESMVAKEKLLDDLRQNLEPSQKKNQHFELLWLTTKSSTAELENRLAKSESELELEKVRSLNLKDQLEKVKKRSNGALLNGGAASGENLSDADILAFKLKLAKERITC